MRDPVCPEHGLSMYYELQPNWWRCVNSRCQIRIFDEDRAAYVPATSIRWIRGLGTGLIPRPGITTWHRLEAT